MIAFSICLIVTASPSRISSTHAASHGAGHRRPVNSGKLLVACSCAIASCEAVAVDEVVPVGDQVAERAAVVAEGHAAVHAAGALLAQLRHRPREQELAVVVRALARVPLGDAVALDLQEAAELAHQAPVSPTASSGALASRRRSRQPAPRAPLPRRVRAARACSRGASPSRTRRAASSCVPVARARARRPASRCAARCSSIIARSSIASASDELFEADHAHVAALGERARPRRARRRRRRSCRPRSCARSGRARRRARRSCTRSRGRRRPRRPPRRPSCAPRSARPRGRGRTRARAVAPYSTVLPTITFSSALKCSPMPSRRADREARRRRGPCRRSRWRRRAA